METVSAWSDDDDAQSRKFLSLCLQQLASVGQRSAAEAVGVHESTISRMKDGELEKLCKLLTSLNLKVVPAAVRCYRPEDIDPYIQLAKQMVSKVQGAEELAWDG